MRVSAIREKFDGGPCRHHEKRYLAGKITKIIKNRIQTIRLDVFQDLAAHH